MTYHTGLNTQYAILQCTLEDVLENFGDDEETVAMLIENPQDAGWKDPSLQKALLRKLGRNYRPFLGNMNSLSELLERLSRKLGLPATETNVSNLGTLQATFHPSMDQAGELNLPRKTLIRCI